MKEKYIVVANTYSYYACRITVFGIFDTEKEAINFIINNPVQKISAECAGLWDADDKEDVSFDFFEYIDHTNETKEEYAKRFIKTFNGVPLLVGQYSE